MCVCVCVQGCFSGGLYALTSIHAINGKSEHYMDLGKKITDTCHESYRQTGLAFTLSFTPRLLMLLPPFFIPLSLSLPFLSPSSPSLVIFPASKLAPEAFRFDANGAVSSKSNERVYILRPETVESYFVLWRLTHDQKYRDWGWDMVQVRMYWLNIQLACPVQDSPKYCLLACPVSRTEVAIHH